MFNSVTTMITLGVMILQLGTLYLAWKMYKFAKQYSRQWSRAWLVFLVVMLLGVIRRGFVVIWALGIDGNLQKTIQWLDHMILSTTYGIAWLLFIYLMLRWWKFYFAKYVKNAGLILEREDIVTKREDIATQRENVVKKRGELASKREERIGREEKLLSYGHILEPIGKCDDPEGELLLVSAGGEIPERCKSCKHFQTGNTKGVKFICVGDRNRDNT